MFIWMIYISFVSMSFNFVNFVYQESTEKDIEGELQQLQQQQQWLLPLSAGMSRVGSDCQPLALGSSKAFTITDSMN